jgi:hypothetical protein
MLVGHMFCEVCQGLLKIDVVLTDALRRTHLYTVPGVPVLLVLVLQTVIGVKRLSEEFTRGRGLIPTICPLVGLIDVCPQGTGSTLQIRGCQPDVIRVWSSTKIIFDNWGPTTHMLALLLVPILQGTAGMKRSTLAAPCAAA